MEAVGNGEFFNDDDDDDVVVVVDKGGNVNGGTGGDFAARAFDNDSDSAIRAEDNLLLFLRGLIFGMEPF